MSRLNCSLESEGSLEIGPIFDSLNVSITHSPIIALKMLMLILLLYNDRLYLL